MLFYRDHAFSGACTDSDNYYVFHQGSLIKTIPHGKDTHCFFKLSNIHNRLSVYASANGRKWTILAEDLDISKMNHNYLNGFLAMRPALMVKGDSTAEFRHFVYKPLGD